MIEWYEHLICGPTISRRRCRKIKYKVANFQVQPVVYLIVQNEKARDLLEIIPSTVLLQKNYPSDGLKAVGLASTRQEALRVTEKLIRDMYVRQKDFDIERYMDR